MLRGGLRAQTAARQLGRGVGRLLSSVASSIYAAYALADRFTIPEYWASGTQYGNPSGPNELNGDPGFDSAGYWTCDAGVTISGSKANWAAVGSNFQAYHGGIVVVGASYVVTFTIDSISSGGVRAVLGGVSGTTRSAPGTYTETIIPTGSTNISLSSIGASTTAVCDNFSVKGVGIAALPGYSFARSGQQGAVDASGAVQFFAANVPAINSAGYHSYGALTNAALWSQDFTNAVWIKGASVTVTADQAVAPDGTTTADLVDLTSASVGVGLYQAYGVSTGVTYTRGIWLKGFAGGEILTVTDPGGSLPGTTTFTLTTAWQFFTYITTASASGTGGIWLQKNSGNKFYAWQHQILAGNFPNGGPLIVTTTAAASIGASALDLTNPITTDQDFIFYVVVKEIGAVPPASAYDVYGVLGAPYPTAIYLQRDQTGALLYQQGTSTSTGPTAASGRAVLLGRRRGGKDTIATKVGSTVVIGTESGATTWASPSTLMRIGYYSGPQWNAAASEEGVFIQTGTFSDAQLTTLLTGL